MWHSGQGQSHPGETVDGAPLSSSLCFDGSAQRRSKGEAGEAREARVAGELERLVRPPRPRGRQVWRGERAASEAFDVDVNIWLIVEMLAKIRCAMPSLRCRQRQAVEKTRGESQPCYAITACDCNNKARRRKRMRSRPSRASRPTMPGRKSNTSFSITSHQDNTTSEPVLKTITGNGEFAGATTSVYCGKVSPY